MSVPQTNHPPAEVSKGTLGIIARVQADEDTTKLADPTMAKRDALKVAMRNAVDGDDARIIAAGALSTAQAKTDVALKAFGKKVAGEYADAKPAGEKHPEYKRLFNGKTAASVLPDARDERGAAIDAVVKEINDTKSSAAVKKAAAPFLKAVVKEKAAGATLGKAEAALEKLTGKLEEAKVATVVAVRALAGVLQTKFADDPARARQLLGQGTGGAKKKGGKKKEESKPAPGDDSEPTEG